MDVPGIRTYRPGSPMAIAEGRNLCFSLLWCKCMKFAEIRVDVPGTRAHKLYSAVPQAEMRTALHN